MQKDVQTLSKKGAHILIATPGRLLDLMDRQLNSGLLQAVKGLVRPVIFNFACNISHNFYFYQQRFNKFCRNFWCLTRLTDFWIWGLRSL